MFTALTQAQTNVQAAAAVVARQLQPEVIAADREGRAARGVRDALANAGLLGLCLPRRYSGLGADYVALGLACEELEAVDATLRVMVSVHLGLHALGILQWGTDEQRERWLPPLARGERLGLFALTDEGAGSDPARMASTARRDGNAYVVNGLKRWISLAGDADQMLWIARTDEGEPAHEHLSAFIIDMRAPGVTTRLIEDKVGLRAMHTGTIRCDDVSVPVGDRLGEEGEGFKIAMACLDNGRYTVGAGAAGTIRACLGLARDYALRREAFGRPIARQQLIQQKIAAIAGDYDIVRLLYGQVGALKNNGTRNTRETSLLKWRATESAFAAADATLQIFGAEGYAATQPIERIWRNARVGALYEGTNEIHQLLQAGYALGERTDATLRRDLPAYNDETWS